MITIIQPPLFLIVVVGFVELYDKQDVCGSIELVFCGKTLQKLTNEKPKTNIYGNREIEF